jgi:hypothetical protein
MNSERLVDPSDVLLPYRQMRAATAVGGVSVATYLEPFRQPVAELGPGARYDHAWSGLELVGAMAISVDGDTGEPFQPKTIKTITKQVQSEFRDMHQDNATPPVLRARARLAEVNVVQYHELLAGTYKFPGRHFVPYMAALHKSARELLQLSDPTDDELHMLRTMSLIAVMSEKWITSAAHLLASPRQPWDVNRYHGGRPTPVPIAIGDMGFAGGVSVPSSALEYDEWATPDVSAVEAPLRRYLAHRIGLGTKFSAVMGPFAEHVLRNVTPGTQAIEASGQEKLSLSTRWYVDQSSYDLDAMMPSTLRVHIAQLEGQFATEGLPPNEQYALAWMHIDYGRMLADQARTARQTAERERRTAQNVSRLVAPKHEQLAEAAEQEFGAKMATAAEYFDTAIALFAHNAEQMRAEYPGGYYECALDEAAAPVYKALFTEAPQDELEEAGATYMQRIASLVSDMSAAEKRLEKTDEEEYGTLHAVATRMAVCLLALGVNSEESRQLVLPVSLRKGGSREEIDAIAYPMDYAHGTYDSASPVYIFLTLRVPQLVQQGREVTVSIDELDPSLRPVALLGDIIAVMSGQEVKDGARIADMAQRLSDAIVDADES